MCEVISDIYDRHLRQLLHARDLWSMKINFFWWKLKILPLGLGLSSAGNRIGYEQSQGDHWPVKHFHVHVRKMLHQQKLWVNNRLLPLTWWRSLIVRHVSTNILAATVILIVWLQLIAPTPVDHPQSNIYRCWSRFWHFARSAVIKFHFLELQTGPGQDETIFLQHLHVMSFFFLLLHNSRGFCLEKNLFSPFREQHESPDTLRSFKALKWDSKIIIKKSTAKKSNRQTAELKKYLERGENKDGNFSSKSVQLFEFLFVTN